MDDDSYLSETRVNSGLYGSRDADGDGMFTGEEQQVGSVTAVAILLFLLALRHSGERAGRMAERVEDMEKTHHPQRRMREAAARRPRSRGDLARRLRDGPFRPWRPRDGPPVVGSGQEFRARAVEEPVPLPDGPVVAEILAERAVMREQARACRLG